MVEFAVIRRNMVDTQLRTYDVTSKRLLDAVESVEREHFVPETLRSLAYIDQAITLVASDGETRGLLPPMVLARMIQAADIEAGDNVLDVAGGSGYGAAIMTAMGASVSMLESSEAMAAIARSSLEKAQISGIAIAVGDIGAGLSQHGGFDVILVNGAMQAEPAKLLAQLNDGGRLIVVIGSGRSGRVTIFLRAGEAIGHHTVFDASVPALEAFRQTSGFQF